MCSQKKAFPHLPPQSTKARRHSSPPSRLVARGAWKTILSGASASICTILLFIFFNGCWNHAISPASYMPACYYALRGEGGHVRGAGEDGSEIENSKHKIYVYGILKMSKTLHKILHSFKKSWLWGAFSDTWVLRCGGVLLLLFFGFCYSVH